MIFTVGHSTMSPDDFDRLLATAPVKIDTVMDIRSHPGSKKWPWYNRAEMEKWLPKKGTGYVWEPRLGGYTKKHVRYAKCLAEHGVDVYSYAGRDFPKQRIGVKRKDAPLPLFDGPGPHWTNQGLYDYSWFMSLREFTKGAQDLIERGKKENVAIMCCETLWWKCHRSMVSDYLVFAGSDATHLQPRLTPHSQVIGDRLDRYDAEIVASWIVEGGN